MKNILSKLRARMDRRSQPLSAKDAQAFQLALSLYEKRQYDKSLAEVEQIIKRRKEQVHGESLCLKALVLHQMKRDSDEVRRLMEEGTRVDEKSHVAWHMSGIYHKLRKEYTEAYAAYLTSYRLYRDNPNVLQDLAMLATQQRDFATLVDVRRRILGSRMSVRMAWTGLAAAQFLNKDYTGVEQTVKLFDEVMGIEKKTKAGSSKTTGKTAGKKDKKDKTQVERKPPATPQELTDDVEISEMLMLRSRALYEQGEYARALEDLAANEHRVLDRLAWHETKAAALLHVDVAKGRDTYLQLLKRNPENRTYYEALERAGTNWTKLYRDLQQRFPRSDMAFGRPLLLFSVDAGSPHYDPEWKVHFVAYVRGKLDRGVPGAFKLVEPLYADDAKRAVACEAVSEMLGAELSVAEALFLAHHCAHTNEVVRGLEILDKKVAEVGSSVDVDTEIDLGLARAALLEQVGAYHRSGEIWAELSEKVPGDRALNTGAAAAMLRANDLEKGADLAFKFPIFGKYAENHVEALDHITSVESVNVLLNFAKAHARRREHGLAVKRALKVIDIFKLYFDEQYDFHFYGPRRGTLRAYADMVTWEDTLFTSPTYQQALELVVSEWIAIARGESDGLTEKEVSAAKRHRASQLDKLDLEKDSDPFGIAQLESKTALQTAFELWKLLEESTKASGRPQAAVHWLGFRILLAQKKYVLANQELKRAKEAGLSGSKLAAGGLMARHTLETDEQAPQVLRSVQLKLLPAVVPMGDVVGADPVEYANEHVTDLLDWIRVRQFVHAMDGVEPQVIARLAGITDSAAVAEQAYLILQREPKQPEALAAAIKEQWPLQTFIST